MIALVQRVAEASVVVDGATTGRIGAGLLVFVCAEPDDGGAQLQRLADKLLKLRVFGDENGRMNRSVQEVGGGLLVVSQFTLAADVSGGNRPSFSGAAEPGHARACYEQLLELLRQRHPVVQAGVFGAHMQVSLLNDGPVTLPLRVT